MAGRFASWLLHHRQCLSGSLLDMLHNPFSTLMSLSVIAIALALPGGMYAALDNVNEITADFEHGTKLSLFLTNDIDVDHGQELASELAKLPSIEHVELITPDEAMAEFKARSGLRDALESLGHNPLPVVLQVYPTADVGNNAARLAGLIEQLNSRDEVEIAQFDLEWVKRLNALIQLAHRAVWVLAAVLGLGVFLIIGNTIRLAIANRHEEIGIVRLIGGTDAFIRRPFLYSGTLQALFGALLALLAIQLIFTFMEAPVQRLSTLYGTQFELNGLTALPAMILVIGGALTGWLSSRFTVGMYLLRADPEKEAEK